MTDKSRELLQKAVDLYTNYQLTAQVIEGADVMEVGRWINEARTELEATKFDAFHAELKLLLDKYQFMLSTTLYDDITVNTRRRAGDPAIWCELVDNT